MKLLPSHSWVVVGIFASLIVLSKFWCLKFYCIVLFVLCCVNKKPVKISFLKFAEVIRSYCIFIFVCLCAFFRTILLSIISLLNEPNTFSPANVDASVAFRKWRDSKGKEKDYANIIRWFLFSDCDCVTFFLFNWPVVPELVWIGLGTNEIY